MKEFVISMVIGLFSLLIVTWVGLFLSGNTVTDVEKQFLKNATSLKAECEKPLPRTQQCVIQYIPEQQ